MISEGCNTAGNSEPVVEPRNTELTESYRGVAQRSRPDTFVGKTFPIRN